MQLRSSAEFRSSVQFRSSVWFRGTVQYHDSYGFRGSARYRDSAGIPPNSAVTSVTPGLATPATPTVPPMLPEFQTLPVPSTVLCNAIPQTVQAVTRSYVPTTAGYMRPWVCSASGSVPVGSVPAYGWTNGVSLPVGPQVATGWVTGLPEQARGTALAVPNQNPLANPTASSVAVQNSVNNVTGIPESPVLQSNSSVSATGSYTSPSVVPTGVSG